MAKVGGLLKNGKLEDWKDGLVEDWNEGRMEGWNVEALAEIPLRREKIGMMEEWK